MSETKVKKKNRPSNIPLYQRIHSDLSQRIKDGEWNYGAMLPSEFELSEIYKISRGTLRQVLTELENEGFVRRERGRGTFITYSPLRRTASTSNNHTISFIVPYVRDSYVSSILLGLEREARINKYAVIFSHFENDPEKQEQALATALQQRVSGIVLYPVNSRAGSPLLLELVQKKFPAVLVDRYLPGLDMDYVTSDNFSGGLIATQHLLCLGHKQVAFLNWTESATSINHRLAGYRQALEEAGIRPESRLVWEVKGYPEIDQTALEEKLGEPDRPTAIFAANDQLAISVQKAARKVGLSIPSDLALVGFDNLDISAHLDIPLTTVAQPAFGIGQTAWEVLSFKLLSETGLVQKRLLPVQLIIRRSCGAIALSRKEAEQKQNPVNTP